MGTLWRSEDMVLIQIHCQREAAHSTVAELGELGVVQFKDLNTGVSAFQRIFVNDVKRCDEMERKLRFFNEQIDSLNVRKPFVSEEDVSSLEELETMFEGYESELKGVNSHTEMLKTDRNRLVELHHVLTQNPQFFSFDGAGAAAAENEDSASLIEDGNVASASRGGHLGFVTGVIASDKMPTFERILFRATRGNLLLRHAEIQEPVEDPVTGQKLKKDVFIIFFSGERARTKITKICESFNANLYPYPDNTADVKTMQTQVVGRLRELDQVLDQTTQSKKSLLQKLANSIDGWKERITKEKAIFHTLNMFDFKTSRQSAISQGWIPSADFEAVNSCIKRAQKKAGAQVGSFIEKINTREVPPTYFRTDKVSSGFQAIVDSYGIARYKEVNPGVFTIITFPFLFAVMFGDAGHGIMMAIVGALMCIFEGKLAKNGSGELFKMIFGGRYVILLMGIFSIYTGFIYNDWFSLMVNTFGSGYKFSGESLQSERVGTCYFGLDAAWYGTPNKLTILNSYKMKLSVILGVTQMIVGIILSLFNHLHHHDMLDVITEFIPEMIFMCFTFGYMVVIIFVKWSIDYTVPGNGAPPNLLQTMTDFFLQIGGVSPGNDLYTGQAGLQTVLILLALLSVPCLLFPKPLILRSRHRKALALSGGHSVNHGEDKEAGAVAEAHEEEEPFEFGEIMVHQMIHTIEFVLGAVSNTASYLRLWALSLAHSQLSEVFWEQLMMRAFEEEPSPTQVIMLFCFFAAWLGATIGVLLLMESLSAFLHALRLHWVEFQNKFYKGDGYKFMPFAFAKLLTDEGSDE